MAETSPTNAWSRVADGQHGTAAEDRDAGEQSSSLRSNSLENSDSIADTRAIEDSPSGSAGKSDPAGGRLSELKRFTLWETKTHFYMIAYNTSQTLFRILKIDRLPGKRDQTKAVRKDDTLQKVNEGSIEPHGQDSIDWKLNVVADRVVYTRTQVSELLDMISEGNKSAGGLKEIGRFFGIVGFIRFTATYYMVLITRRSVVGLLGGHYIYHCDETKIIPVCPSSVLATMVGRTKALDQEEARLLHTFKQVDLSKNFYFSYTYDLTKTLQDNLTHPADTNTNADVLAAKTSWGYNEKFVWNHHLLLPAFAASEHESASDPTQEWVLPLLHGFVDQAKLRVLNCTIYVTLIARRSRHFAGARFLKRGTDEKGHVANDVETEQIVSDALTTPFYAPAKRHSKSGAKVQARKANPRYTSYVMHRGSIPIYWTQDSTNLSPRPPIEISVVDPYYSAAALHFDDLLRRYGCPIIILNLIKSKERQPREVKLLHAFGECVRYLNQFLPLNKRLQYIAWDMSRASKSRDQDVIGVLEDIAEETLNATKFFHSGPEPARVKYDDSGRRTTGRQTILTQSGVARVNCVDCLDRTNAAQFVIGKAAFGHQLYALGLLDHPNLPFDSDAIDMLTEMYHDLGDTIALQYGGSQLVNTMETYRKINQWTSHSRDMLQGLKRYYSNSFVDAEKQMAINLFLGVANDVPDFQIVNEKSRRHYQRWFTPEHLVTSNVLQERERWLQTFAKRTSSFWAEYYRPSLFTDLMRHHAFKMTAIHQQNAALSTSKMTHVPLSPISSSGSATSLRSPQMSSPRGKAYSDRTRRDSMTSSIAAPSVMVVSPFVSRLPLSSPTKSNPMSARRNSGGGGTSEHQKSALIGGVRRWMSLNRGEENARNESGSSLHETQVSNSSQVAESAKDKTGMADQAASLKPLSAWPTWDEITGVATLAPTTEALLSRYLSPTISSDEAKEYSSWLDQFKDVDFDVGADEAVPTPAALMAAGHVQNPSDMSTMQRSLRSNNRQARASATGEASLAPSALVASQQLHTIAIRQPATQKQRQQIAEADARLYERHVALANGKHGVLGFEDGQHAEDLDGQEAARTKRKSNEAYFSQYQLSANALHAPASDAKVRAFTRWLTGHHQSLAISTQ
jgi:hypothetical protein